MMAIRRDVVGSNRGLVEIAFERRSQEDLCPGAKRGSLVRIAPVAIRIIDGYGGDVYTVACDAHRRRR